MITESGHPRSKHESFIEIDSDGNYKVGRSQYIEAGPDGIKVHAVHKDRVLGVDQVRHQAEMLLKAAEHAEKAGCPAVLME